MSTEVSLYSAKITIDKVVSLPDSISVNNEWMSKGKEVLADAKDICRITSQEDFNAADTALKSLTKHSNMLDKQRLDFTKPITAFAKLAKKVSDGARLPIEEEKRRLKGMMANWIRKKREEEQKSAEEAAKEASSNPFAMQILENTSSEPAVKMKGCVAKDVWKWEIVDESKLPREFMVPNTTAINAAVRANKSATEIPGLKVWSETTVQSR